MPDYSQWSVPVSVIAQSRALHYATDEKPYPTAFDEAEEFFSKNPGEIEDWAKNNMSWSDVGNHATQVGVAQTDYEEGWANGEAEIDPEDRDGA